MGFPKLNGFIVLSVLVLWLAAHIHCAENESEEDDFDIPQQNQTLSATSSNTLTITLVRGFIQQALKDSPFKNIVMTLVNMFLGPNSLFTRQKRQATPLFYGISFLRIVWQFINGVAKPYLKTYLVPIQLLFAYMTPRMFLKDCLKLNTTPLLPGARTFAPFTIAPSPQKFFECTVDIITQFILVVKLMANMAASVF